MTPQLGFPAALMRGGTSKGLVVLADDLPADPAERDRVLLAALGSPDPRQIDGLGGAHPLTSKVAVVSRSLRADADVEYLFLQIWPERALVSADQNCGNMLAAVGPFALETGLLPVAADDSTPVRIWMLNTGSLAIAHVQTELGRPRYDGTAHIDGVPGGHAPIAIEFVDIAGSTCGALLPTGRVLDLAAGVAVTCLDNGMPVVCVAAADLGVSGDESPAELEDDRELGARVEAVRLAAGPMMNLGDVTTAGVPKVALLAPPRHGGAISTRTFIPHRVHDAIGVLGAVSVATACVLPGSVAATLAEVDQSGGRHDLDIEHPDGAFAITLDVDVSGPAVVIERTSLMRTARLLMRGEVYVPARAR